MPETNLNTEVHASTESPAETTGVLGKLGVNGQLFLAHLLNFAIILAIMWRFVYRPLMKKMDERAKKIGDGLRFSDEADARLREAAKEKEDLIRDARAQSKALIEEATVKAEVMRQEKLVQAKTEIEKVISEAKQQIADERAASFKALQHDIADLVTQATTKVVTGLEDKDQRALIKQAIKEIEQA